uniref:Uncharacterized protein n=1 Tax=Alexandrium monilatum TaxID=311494 RepID=A0A7S4PYL4_9DINO
MHGGAGVRSHDAQEPQYWIYYATHRDWCDHLIFCEDGSYVQGALMGCGTWRISQSDDGGLLLHLLPAPPSGKVLPVHRVAPKHEVFVSPDGRTDRFIAGIAEVQLQGATGLPLKGILPSERRGLVFSSVGSQCLPVVRGHWLDAPSAVDFDVVLVYYGDEGTEVHRALLQLACEYPFVQVDQNKDFKWPNFRRWMEMRGGSAALAARYDYVWVVDDDVRLGTEGISKLFAILRDREHIQFACPSFDDESEGVWRYFDKHDPRFHLRYTDFVECTAPVVKTSMFLDHVFSRCLQAAHTGCFLDFCFHPASGARDNCVAVIDAVQCNHPPRDESVPSELRAIMPWEDHRHDAAYFEQAGLPREWWWYRKPVAFSGEPAQAACAEPAAPPELRPVSGAPPPGNSAKPSPASELAAASPPAQAADGLVGRFPGPTSAEDALRELAERAERGEAWPAFAASAAVMPCGPATPIGSPKVGAGEARLAWQAPPRAERPVVGAARDVLGS